VVADCLEANWPPLLLEHEMGGWGGVVGGGQAHRLRDRAGLWCAQAGGIVHAIHTASLPRD
jgi:hypothetical protein